jgi:nucleotide-binding universal stress UspA family protein
VPGGIDVRRILCPVDFDAPSAHALEHAARLAVFYGSSLDVLHVTPTREADEVRRAARTLARFVEGATGPHIRVKRNLRTGRPAAGIEALAEELPADLVVMGTHGRTGLAHLLHGSVTESVLHHVRCPVLTLSGASARPAAPPYERILCATDLRPGSDATVALALALAAGNESLVELLYVVEDLPAGVASLAPRRSSTHAGRLRLHLAEAATVRLSAAIPEGCQGCRFERRVATGEASLAILDAARASDAQLIVLGAPAAARGRTSFATTADRVLRGASCAVLVLRHRQDRGRAREARPRRATARR